MEPLFDLCVSDINVLLPCIKNQLMLGNAQVVKKILKLLTTTNESERGIVVEKLVKFDVISAICDIMQTADEDFVKVVLECIEILSAQKEFYENQAAIITIQTMLRLSYCINKSLKDSMLFEKLIQCVSDVLVRSLKLDVSLDTSCILQQIVLFVKNLNIEDMQKNKLKFAAVTMLNVALQKQAAFDENTDEKMIIDVCHNILKSMTKVVKYDDDDNAILLAVDSLCSTCASSSRFCFIQDSTKKNEIEHTVCEKKENLEICVYNTMMDIIIPYVKQNANLSHLDLTGFYRNLIFCLNYLYQLENCNKDNLSNHLAANGYLKRFVYLSVQFSENLRKSTCILLSRILSILGKTAFSMETAKFANILHLGLLKLPKDSTKWNDAVAHKNGSALIILLYYHFLGTRENNVVSLESLIARVMQLSKSMPISVPILKPLWLLFAVTSLSHPRPNLIYHYENAVNRMTNILLHSEIGEFYTHHVDLLRYYLECPNISQDLLNRILNLWLIESNGDIKPLSFNSSKIVQHLLLVIHGGYPKSIVDVAVKGLHHLTQIIKDDKQLMDQVADIVWRTTPDILSTYQPESVAHIKTTLELANIIQPSTIPIAFVIRSADNIVNITLKKNTDAKFMTLILTQAYILLDVTMSCNSFEVLEIYVKNFQLLRQLYEYGFSKERSQLSTASIKLLTYIICCQKKTPIKCKKPLTVRIKNLVELLTHARESPCTMMNEVQFICKLLTLNDDGSAIILQNIMTHIDNMYLISLYEIHHIICVQTYPISQDMVYQSLMTLLYFCNSKVTVLMPHLCTLMSTYDLILNVNMQHLSGHFVKFVATWLHYRKVNCNDVPWNPKALCKTPFDEVLDKLKEYLILLNNKGMTEAYQNLQSALSQFE